MKSHTSEFKEEIKTLGKQQSVRITYKENNVTKTLTNEDINSVTPNYEASLLKSVMKALELDSNISIPKDTEIKFEYGLLVNGAYEYLDYGNYIVAKEPEKQEDTLSYKITCYDKMLYSMKDYEHIDIPYPCTIKQYLIALCNKIGLQFKDSDFANANRQITSELFMTINEDGTYSSMGYTYRDVLDQIAETTGGCICMTLDDKVEVRYINKAINYETSKKSTNIEFESSVKEIVKIKELDGKSTQATRSGKNYFDASKIANTNIIVSDNGKTITMPIATSGNGYTTTNKKLSELCPELKVGDTAYLIFDRNLGYTYSNYIYLLGKNEIWYLNRSKTITQEILDSIVIMYGNNFSTGETKQVILTNFRIVKNKDDEWEPYGASPSPEFPSEIKSVGDEGTVTIEQRGKNLGKNNIVSGQKGGLTITKYDDDTFRVQGITTEDVYIYGSKNNIDLDAGTYIMSGCPIGGSSQTYNLFLDGIDGTNDYGNERTFVITEHISSKYVLKIKSGQTVDFIVKPMLRFATIQDNTYEPYFSKDYVLQTKPLRSLPNGTKDTIEEDGIHRLIGNYVCDGTETVTINNQSVNTFRIDNIPNAYTESNNVLNGALCSHFKENVQAKLYNGTVGFAMYGGNSNKAYICFGADSEINTVEKVKQWFTEQYEQGTPLIFQYELAEEVVEPFDKEQQSVINSMVTEKGTNIFEFESNAILNYPVNYDTINEEYINDTNVNFGEKYGPINSIVLARASDSDRIYKKDQTSIDKNGLCELKISENQFMNFNDRADYLQGLADKLFGVEYYLNDFVSTGIMYYDLLDMYNVEIFGKTYNCLMLNNEQDITQGLEENIHTDRPEKSETDYTKADKTDRKINQTNLIVDKQNQKIEGVISQIGDRSEKTTTITADIDGLNSKVSQIEDITDETSSTTGTLVLENCQKGPLLNLKIFGNNNVFKYLYPSDTLYPSNTLYPYGDSRIIVTNFLDGSEIGTSKTYELGVMDVLRQKGNIRDELILDQSRAKIIRRINKDGSIKDNEEIEELGEIHIDLEKGKNVMQIQNYTAEMYCKYAIQSEYTDIFATKVEMNSSINQTAEEINLEVRKKVDENEVISKINQSAEQISIEANRININGVISANGNFSVDIDGNLECSSGKFYGGLIEGAYINLYSNNDTAADPWIDITNTSTPNEKVEIGSRYIRLNSPDGTSSIDITSADEDDSGYNPRIQIFKRNGGTTLIEGGYIYADEIQQSSLESKKKNFEKLENGLDIIKSTEIYKYNFKKQKDTDKKHIGFVIGDNYKYSKEITSENNDGVDTYSMVSVAYKAIQEQQEMIEQLQKEINELKKKEEK